MINDLLTELHIPDLRSSQLPKCDFTHHCRIPPPSIPLSHRCSPDLQSQLSPVQPWLRLMKCKIHHLRFIFLFCFHTAPLQPLYLPIPRIHQARKMTLFIHHWILSYPIFQRLFFNYQFPFVLVADVAFFESSPFSLHTCFSPTAFFQYVLKVAQKPIILLVL